MTVQKNTKHWIPFGRPSYVIEAPLQSGRGIYKKWEYISKLGIYLGQPPNHVRNMALLLDRTTEFVSPQFYVTFYPRFRTMKQDKFDIQWQYKAGFLINN